MVRLNRNNTLQSFALTLTELCESANPYFLFEFTNVMTKVIQLVILQDKSLYKHRYNLFQIMGDFFFESGFYDYKVYEQYNDTNTNPLLTVGIVEEGLFYLESASNVTFTENNSNVNYVEYEGK